MLVPVQFNDDNSSMSSYPLCPLSRLECHRAHQYAPRHYPSYHDSQSTYLTFAITPGFVRHTRRRHPANIAGTL